MGERREAVSVSECAPVGSVGLPAAIVASMNTHKETSLTADRNREKVEEVREGERIQRKWVPWQRQEFGISDIANVNKSSVQG